MGNPIKKTESSLKDTSNSQHRYNLRKRNTKNEKDSTSHLRDEVHPRQVQVNDVVKHNWNMRSILVIAAIVIFGLSIALLYSEIGDPEINRDKRSFARVKEFKRGVDGPKSPPQQPKTYPSVDQSKMITGSLLTDPLIQSAMAKVKSTVPPAFLNIPVSTYISYSDVKYKGDVGTTCYWPYDLCIRKTATGDGVIVPDGPTQNIVKGVHTEDTAALRAQLDSMNIKATFFATGSNTYQFPQELVASDKSGHQIASHTWTHHPLTSLTNEQIVAEIMYTEAIIYKAIGKVPAYLRPPYGDVDDRVRAIANALGYRIALWDTDSNDTSGPETTVMNTIKSWFTSKTGFVSLEHDIEPATCRYAINSLKAVQKLGADFKLKIMPVGTCNGHPFYSYVQGDVPVVSPGTSDIANSGVTNTTSVESSLSQITTLATTTLNSDTVSGSVITTTTNSSLIATSATPSSSSSSTSTITVTSSTTVSKIQTTSPTALSPWENILKSFQPSSAARLIDRNYFISLFFVFFVFVFVS
ncbi:chitin deacetylase [Nowakowskiella sp. JEL0407]|nr:chitin deacetylase [Nowakowskiella sp. JEL0407]